MFFFSALAFTKKRGKTPKPKIMTDLLPDASSSPSPAPQQRKQLPWSSSSPPSPIELWQVARGAAAARAALDEVEEEGRTEEEEDAGAAEVFGQTLSCSVSLLQDGDEEEGNRWRLEEELLSLECRRSGGEEPGEDGVEEGEGEGEEEEVEEEGRSSPGANQRRSSRHSLSRSRCPAAEKPGKDDEQLEDLIDSMLAMTVRRRMRDRVERREREGKTSGAQKREKFCLRKYL